MSFSFDTVDTKPLISENTNTTIPVDSFRKRRPLITNLSPIISWFFFAFCNFSFVMVEVFPWIGVFDKHLNSNPIVTPA